MKRKIFSILFALVLVLSFSVITAVPAAAQGGAVFTAITNAADRLVALQSTETLGTLDPPDFGWDWVVTGLTEHSGVASGSNLYGVTALGLIDAYQETGNTAYSTAAQLTGDHLKTLSRATDSTVRIQSFDYRFLVEFSALSGDGSYAAHALSEWNWVKTNVPYFYADGNQENIYNFYYTHAGHGFAAWQAGDAGLAALAMGDTSWAGNMAAVLVGHLDEIADSDIYRFIGWGHALEFLNAVDSVAYSTEITGLISNLKVSQNADGSWPGTAAQGTVQNTAYAVMGLAAVGEGDTMAKARKGANWLVANQISTGGSIGGWIETDSQEYSETDSEALQALASVPARPPRPSAGKAPLYDSVGYTCEGGATDTSGPTFGFVVLNTNASGDLIVQVALKGATPNTTYDIWVNQFPGACPLSSPTAPRALTTNVRGNGNAHVKVARVADATNFWVSAVGGGQVLRSTAVELD